MSEFSRRPERERISGHASFLDRGTPWWQMLQIRLADALLWLIGCLLWLGGRPLRRLLVRGLSGLAYRLMRNKQRIANINLDLAYRNQLSAAEKARIIRGMYTHFANGLLDLLFDWVYWPPKDIAHYVTPEGCERLKALQDHPGGSAIVSCHLGNPDLAFKLIRAADFDVFAMYKGFKSPWFDRYIARKRLKIGGALIEVPSSRHRIVNGQRVSLGRQSLRDEVRALFAQNHCIGFLADQYASGNGEMLTVLGVPETPTQSGAWRYVVENRVPFVMLLTVYREDGGLDWRCSEVMQVEDQGEEHATLIHTMNQANAWFEEQIRRNPEQYFWGHRRFNRSHYA